jgi:hypothetical protein
MVRQGIHVLSFAAFVLAVHSLIQLPAAASLPFDAAVDNPCRGSPRRRYDAMDCWLEKLRMPLPDQSFREGILRLSVRDLVCTNFSLMGLSSSYRPSDHQGATTSSHPQLDISLRNVSTVCKGTYHSTGLSGKVQAVVGAAGKETPALTFAWDILSAPLNHSFPQPASIRTTDCQTTLAVTDLHFSGSLSAHTINLFTKEIRSTVSKALSSQLCPLVSETLDPSLNQYLGKINDWLEPYLPDEDAVELVRPSRSVTTAESSDMTIHSRSLLPTGALSSSDTMSTVQRHHSKDHDILSWSRDAPALVQSLHALNQGLQYFLRRGFLQHWLPLDRKTNRPQSCGFFFDGINSLVRSILYEDNGWVELPLLSRWKDLHFTVPNYAAMHLQIRNISVHGLDNWQDLRLFAPDQGETFLTRLSSQNLTLRTRLHLVVSTVPGGVFQGDDLVEDFSIDLNATSLDTTLRVRLDARKSVVNAKVTVGTVWNVLEGVMSRNMSEADLPCLLESVEAFQVDDLSALWKIDGASFLPELDGFRLADSLEEDLDLLLNNALRVVWTEFPVMVTQSIKGLAGGPVQDGLNTFLKRIIATNESCADPGHPDFYPHLIDFNNVGWLRGMNDFFARMSTHQHIDSYLQCGADYMTAAIQERIPNSLLQVQTLEFRNLGHLRDLEVLSPLPDGRSLSSSFSFGTDSLGTLPSLNLQVESTLPSLSAAVNVTVQWNEIGASSITVLHYDLARLKHFPLTQIMEHGQCAIVPANEIDIYGVKSQLAMFSVGVNAVVDYGAQQPAYLNWTSLETPEVQESAAALWTWAVNSTRDMLSLGSLASMSQASNLCQGKPPSFDDEGTNEDYLSISLVVCAIFLLAQPAVLMIRSDTDCAADYQRRIEEQQQEESLPRQPLVTDSEDSEPLAWEGGPRLSLMEHPSIPDIPRILVPVLIVCTIMLLLCSNLSIGASVKLKASFAGETIMSPSIFSFSLSNTAKQMLQAKIYPLLLLVVVFSGVWPYLKLCLMLYGWLMPFSRLGAHSRGRMFLALDALGKFSLVDTYVLVLFLVSFRYHLSIAEDTIMDVYVVPQFGFFAFLVATILSLILSHALVYYHRVAESGRSADAQESGKRLIDHAFQFDVGERVLSHAVKLGMFSFFLVTIVLLAAGMTRESFLFKFGGVAGDLLGERKDAAYSLISLGRALPSSVEDSTSVAILGLQGAYFLFAVAAPFACLLFLFLLFTCPLPLKRQLTLLTLAEIANAWSAAEVFCLSIVAALLEISTFASFIVGDKCDLVDSVLEQYFADASDTCYSVKASVKWSACFLLLGVLLNSFLASFALRIAHTAIDERISRECSRGNHSDSLAPRFPSIVERIASFQCMQWVIHSTSQDDISVGPPINSGEPSSPWQRHDQFESEWREAAERDPQWKDWKEATSVT